MSQLTQDEVCIDGTVYDIKAFAPTHPGGSQVRACVRSLAHYVGSLSALAQRARSARITY